MKIRKLSVCLSMLIILCGPFAARGGDDPGAAPDEKAALGHAAAGAMVVATVNGVDIHMSDMIRETMKVIEGYHFKKLTPDLSAQIKKRAVKRLVMEELVYQEAGRQGIKVTPDAVRARIAAVIGDMGGEDKFLEYLKHENLSEDGFWTRTERLLAAEQVIKREVDDKVKVTEEDVKAAYDQAKERYFVQQEKVSVSAVVFFLDPGTPGDVNKAAAIRTRLVNELEGDPKSLQSDGTFVVRDYEPKKGGKMYEEAMKLKEGEISGVVNLDGTLYILKLNKYVPRVEKGLEEVRPYLRKKLREQFREQRLTEWMDGLNKDADIEIKLPEEQGTGDRRQGTGDRRQETGDRRQGTGDRRQETGDRGQETGDRGQE